MCQPEQSPGVVIDSILSDYALGREIDALSPNCRPDKGAVTAITGKLLQTVYPGFFREWGTTRLALSAGIEDTWARLRQQICLVLCRDMDPETAQLRAEEQCYAFFRQIPALRATAQTDVEAAFDGDPAAASREEILFCYPGLYAVTVYRLAHVLYALDVPMLPRIMTEHAHSLTGIDIHPGASIGNRFFIDHGTGTVIGETAVIGENVKIYQGVTLGGLSTRAGQALRGTKRHPTIEDNVTVYAGASILGGETVIGRDSVIGANAFITQSIPACTRVSTKNQELQLKARDCAHCPRRFTE